MQAIFECGSGVQIGLACTPPQCYRQILQQFSLASARLCWLLRVGGDNCISFVALKREPGSMDVKAAVTSVLGKGDDTVLDYVAACLEDEDFEWGDDATEALEAFGEMLVGCRRCCHLLPPPAAAAAVVLPAATYAAGHPVHAALPAGG
jgi:hypothetical protein